MAGIITQRKERTYFARSKFLRVARGHHALRNFLTIAARV